MYSNVMYAASQCTDVQIYVNDQLCVLQSDIYNLKFNYIKLVSWCDRHSHAKHGYATWVAFIYASVTFETIPPLPKIGLMEVVIQFNIRGVDRSNLKW